MTKNDNDKPSLNQALEMGYRNMPFPQLFLLIIITPIYHYFSNNNSGIELLFIKWSLILHALFITFYYLYIRPCYKNFNLNEKYFWVIISSVMLYWMFILTMYVPNLNYSHIYYFFAVFFIIQLILSALFIKIYKNVHKSFSQTTYGGLAMIIFPSAFVFARLTGEGQPEFARMMVLICFALVSTVNLLVILKCSMAWRADVLAMRERKN